MTREMSTSIFEQQVEEVARWFDGPRFEGIVRLYSPPARWPSSAARIRTDYPVARDGGGGLLRPPARALRAAARDHHLRPLLAGPGRDHEAAGHRGHLPRAAGPPRPRARSREDPGADLASYPLSQVPDEAAPIVRALLTADKNQHFAALPHERGSSAATPAGRLPALHHRRRRHRPRRRRPRAQPDPPLRRGRRARLPHRGPEARREEVRPPGRQGAGARGRADQAPQRRALPARRHGGAGHHRGPHRRRVRDLPRRPRRRARPAVHPRRHQPSTCPSYKAGYLAILRRSTSLGVERAERPPAVRHLRRSSTPPPCAWLERAGVASARRATRPRPTRRRRRASVERPARQDRSTRCLEAWQAEAGLKTYGQAVADVDRPSAPSEGERFDMSLEEWRAFARKASFYAAREKARALGIDVAWDCERAKTPEGYYQVQGGIEYAHRQVAGGGALRRHPVDGDEDRRPRGRQRVRRGHPRRVPRQDARLQPVAVVQLGHHGHDRRRRCGASPRSWGSSATSSTSSPTAGTRSTAWPAEEFATALQTGRHAGPGAAAAEVPPGGVALPHAADPGRRPARSTRALMASRAAPPPPRPWARARRSSSTSCRPRSPPSCWRSGSALWAQAQPAPAGAARAPAAAHRRLGGPGAGVSTTRATSRRPTSSSPASRTGAGRSILSVRDQNTFDQALRKKRLMTLVTCS